MAKRKIKRGLWPIIFATVFLAGCSQDDGALLRPYTQQIQTDTYSSNQALFRATGAATGICVIEDESKFEADEIAANAAVFFNIDKREVLYSKEAYTKNNIASLTKLMTALLVFEYGDLDEVVTLGDEVLITTYDAWLCGFQPGDKVLLSDLLKASLVYSGNDAANAAAVAVGGSLDDFVNMMNRKAAALGATGTHFANPNGLDQSGHYSTAYDMYLIFNECLKYAEFREIMPLAKFECTYTNAEGTEITKTFSSGNGYLNATAVAPADVLVYGGKTGHTESAGYCLATLAKSAAGDEYIAIVLGTDEKQQVYAQTNLLLEKIQ